MLDAVEIEDAIQKKDAARLAELIKNNQLKLQHNKVTADDHTIAKASDFWDRRQLIKT